MSADDDARLMRRAIAAAMRNLGLTYPNPTVGCVIARGGEVVAEAATAPGGRPHAEEEALASAGASARGAVCYVTLEPCGARSSDTLSCSERLAAAGVTRVVIACEDPSPFAGGQGLERLRAAGVPAEIGLLAAEADVLSAGFRHRLATGLPLVWAAAGPETFEAAFEPAPGEGLEDALRRYGRLEFGRLWTPRGGDLARRMSELGLLAEDPPEANR